MTRRSPRRARRLLEPTWLSRPIYVETFGPEVADIGNLAGFEPDPEQQLFLDLLFAIRPDGKSASFENVLIGPRQNLKTGTIKLAELGWLYVTEQPLVIHSAHELDTTEGAFNDLRELIENTPQLASHLDVTIGKLDSRGITSGNGKWSIFLRTGDGRRLQIKYKARTQTGGRGLTANKLVLDEAFAVSQRMIGSVYPTLSAVPDPQVLLASSAGLRDSVFLRSLRDRGREGQDPRLTYMEYGDDVARYGGCRPGCTHARPPRNPPGCVLDDVRRWRRFMTALGRRITEETVRDMRRTMPPEEFAREFMVHWDDPPNSDDAPGVLDLDRWLKLTDRNAPAPKRVEIVFDVEPDRSSSTIAAAGAAPDGRTIILVTVLPGTAQTVSTLKALTEKRDVVSPVGLMPNSQAGALIPDLVEENVAWEPISTVQVGQATAAFIEGIQHGRYVHVGQDEFARAIENATTRFTAQGEAEVWDRRDKTINIGPVVAGSVAAYRWGLTKKQPPPPPVKAAGHSAAARRSNNISTAGF